MSALAGVILTAGLGAMAVEYRRKKKSSAKVGQQKKSDENVVFRKKF